MYPILVSLGPIHLYSFGALFIIGILTSWLLLKYLVEIQSLLIRNFYVGIPWLVVGAALGGRLGFVLTHLDKFYRNWGAVFSIWNWWGEWELWAGVLGASLAMIIFWIKHNEPVFLWLDVMSITVQPLVFFTAFGLLLSPVGLTTEALGGPTTLPWGVMVDAVDLPFANVPVHPLFFYTSAMALITFLILLYLRRWAPRYVGRLFAVMMVFYSGLWSVHYLVRWHIPNPIFGLDLFLFNQVLYLAIAIICGVYIIRKRRLAQKKKLQHFSDL